jgi:hypothetical protein
MTEAAAHRTHLSKTSDILMGHEEAGASGHPTGWHVGKFRSRPLTGLFVSVAIIPHAAVPTVKPAVVHGLNDGTNGEADLFSCAGPTWEK